MIYLGDSRDGAFAAAARVALFDADRGRNARDEIDVRAGHLLGELPGVGVHRIEETPLTLGKQEIERERAFSRTAHAGDDDEFAARNRNRKVLQIVFARAVDANGLANWKRDFVRVKHLPVLAG